MSSKMKVLLLQDVAKLGSAGDVKEVSGGYGRNYLIPQGMAIVATPGEIKTAEHNQAVKARKVAKQEAQLQALADRIHGLALEFQARAGEQGRLFGSITAGDIAEQLSAKVGEEIDRRKVVLDEQLRTTGAHKVVVHLVGRLKPEITVTIVGVDEDGNPIAEKVAVVEAVAEPEAYAYAAEAVEAADEAADEAE